MMHKVFPRAVVLLLLCAALPSLGSAIELYSPPESAKISPKLSSWLSTKDPGDEVKIWVFFTDKGVFTQEDYRRALRDVERALTDRARRRRLRTTAGGDVVDFYDLPVHKPYVEKTKELGAKVMTVSKWLNGISLRAPVDLIPQIESLPFVREIRKVVAYRKKRALKPGTAARLPPPRRVPLYFDYGVSEPQVKQLNVPEAHSKGYTGAGVLICVLDTGFDFNRPGRVGGGHRSLLHIDSQLVAEWDFISGDGHTWYDPDEDPVDKADPTQTYHGTRMLSIIAGYLNNQLIGPAFGASFALARTEWYLSTPTHEDIVAEEQWWIAGSEWADYLGADIISSSLGYRTWEDSADYCYADMDGNTTPLTIAADVAADTVRNILVVTAMGNVLSPGTTRPDTCIKAPADADSIISVGGVYEDGRWAWNDTANTGSIVGPPYDQVGAAERTRWKPDLMAAWVCIVADPVDSVAIQGLGGTSCATALVAGVSALVMEANPSWSNMKVRDALRETASNHASPNDTLGWGIPDVMKAIYYEGEPEVPPYEEDELLPPYPNPFEPQVQSEVIFPYRLINDTFAFLRIYTTSAELVKEYDLGEKMPGRYLTPQTGAVRWNGHNEVGDLVGSGIYICALTTGYGTTIKKLAVIK